MFNTVKTMSKKLTGLILLTLILLTVTTPIIEARMSRNGRIHSNKYHNQVKPKPRNKEIVYLNPTHVWYNYTDHSIYVNTLEMGHYMIDLSNGESDVAIMEHIGWYAPYGDYVAFGTAHVWGQGSFITSWIGRIGELKIDGATNTPPYTFFARYAPGETWYAYTLRDHTPPTDYIVTVHASDGSHILPITSTFRFSTDNGVHWTTFTP